MTQDVTHISPPIVYVDRSVVLAGKLPELRRGIDGLVRLVASADLRLLSYDVYFSEDGSTMTVMHRHPDSDSLERLMDVLAPALPPFAGLLRLLSIDVYGAPSEAVRAQLRRKADLLGSASVTIHESHAGVRPPRD